MPRLLAPHSPCALTPSSPDKVHETDFVHGKDGREWIWIKIPKTGTQAYRAVFFPEIPYTALQTHLPWSHISLALSDPIGFTVVRNPLTRFKSAIGHITASKAHLDIQFEDTEDLVTFFESFEESLHLQFSEDFSPTWGKEHFQLATLNCERCGIWIPGFIHALLKPQIVWAYHPKVRTFKYEHLEEFNSFVKDDLGYDLSLLQRRNVTKTTGIDHLNFNDPRVVALVKRLYAMDYEAFQYA